MPWSKIAHYLAIDHDWEKQTQACKVIKDLSISNPELFDSSDPHQQEVVKQLL